MREFTLLSLMPRLLPGMIIHLKAGANCIIVALAFNIHQKTKSHISSSRFNISDLSTIGQEYPSSYPLTLNGCAHWMREVRHDTDHDADHDTDHDTNHDTVQ